MKTGKNYDPPEDREFKKYYDEVYKDAMENKKYSQPFDDSDDERETTYLDQINQSYYEGYSNGEEDRD